MSNIIRNKTKCLYKMSGIKLNNGKMRKVKKWLQLLSNLFKVKEVIIKFHLILEEN